MTAPLGKRPALRVSWDSASQRREDAVERYRDSLTELYDVTNIGAEGVPFYSRTTGYKLGSSILGRGASVSQTFIRTPDHVRRSHLDHISLILNFATTTGDAAGRSVNAASGAVQFRDLTKPSASHTQRIDVINLVTPRSAAPRWLLGRGVHGLCLPPDSSGGRLVGSHLTTLAEVAADLTEEQAIAAVEATFVIAERFLGSDAEPTPMQVDAIQRTIRRRAMKAIDGMGASPNIAELSRAIGVSRSSLFRAFEGQGGVHRHVQRHRLNRAFAALRARTTFSSALDDVAEQQGFSSTTQFRRAFRSQFGFPPEDVRPSNAGDRGKRLGVADDGLLDGAAHEVMFDWLRLGDDT